MIYVLCPHPKEGNQGMEWGLSPNIIIESSFTHERCSITLPPWVRTLDEVKIYAREAHNNLSTADGTSKRFHPAVVAMLDGDHHQMIADMASLLQCRHIILLTHVSDELSNELTFPTAAGQVQHRAKSASPLVSPAAATTNCETACGKAKQNAQDLLDSKPYPIDSPENPQHGLPSVEADQMGCMSGDVSVEDRREMSCDGLRVLDCSTVDHGNLSADVVTYTQVDEVVDLCHAEIPQAEPHAREVPEQENELLETKDPSEPTEVQQLLQLPAIETATELLKSARCPNKLSEPRQEPLAYQSPPRSTSVDDDGTSICDDNFHTCVPKEALLPFNPLGEHLTPTAPPHHAIDSLIERHQSIIQRVKAHFSTDATQDVQARAPRRLMSPSPPVVDLWRLKLVPLISPPQECQLCQSETPFTNMSILVSADEFVDDFTPEPIVSAHAEPTASGHAEPVASGHTEPIASDHTEPIASGHPKPISSGHTSPKFSPCESCDELLDEVSHHLTDRLPSRVTVTVDEGVKARVISAASPIEPSGIHLDDAVSNTRCSELVTFEAVSGTSAATIRHNTTTYLQECLRLHITSREHLLFREVITEVVDLAALGPHPQVVVEGPAGSGVSTTGAIIALDWMFGRDLTQGVTTLLIPIRRHDAMDLCSHDDEDETSSDELLTFWISEVLDAVGAAVGTNLRSVFAFLFGGDSDDILSPAVETLRHGRVTLFDHESPAALANVVEGIREIRLALKSEDWYSRLYSAVRLLPVVLSKYFGCFREMYFFDNASNAEKALPETHPWILFASHVSEILSEGTYPAAISCIHTQTDPLAHLARAKVLCTIDLVSLDICRNRYGFPLFLQAFDRRSDVRQNFPVSIFLGAPGYLQLLYRFVNENRRTDDDTFVIVEDSESAATLHELSSLSAEIRSR